MCAHFCVCTYVHMRVYTRMCVHYYCDHPVMLLPAAQHYDLERLKKDSDTEKEREATLLEERWDWG